MIALTPHEIARAMGGYANGTQVIAPGPGHSPKDRSLSIKISRDAPNGFLVNSFAGDDPIDCLDYVRAKRLPAFAPQKSATAAHHGALGHKGSGEPAKAATQSLDNYKRAMAIWWSGIEPRGTLVEVYLRSRRLELPRDAWEAIRFQPNCHFCLSERYPAMVCLVRNIVTNERQGVHRTALMPDGTAVKRNGKTLRMSLGPTSGGAIKLDPDDDVAQGLCIGEGVETCLSGRQIGYRPVWAVGLAGITKFPVLPGSDGLTIFGEHDERAQSEKAIRSCADRWLEAGIEVLTAWPLAATISMMKSRWRHDRGIRSTEARRRW